VTASRELAARGPHAFALVAEGGFKTDGFAAGDRLQDIQNLISYVRTLSKGGVVNLTRALALEWAEDRIRVNAVAPTFVNTDFTAQIFNNPAVLEQVEKHTPLGVLPEVDDIAAAILFLASPAARCITGVTLPVDSGYLAR